MRELAISQKKKSKYGNKNYSRYGQYKNNKRTFLHIKSIGVLVPGVCHMTMQQSLPLLLFLSPSSAGEKEGEEEV